MLQFIVMIIFIYIYMCACTVWYARRGEFSSAPRGGKMGIEIEFGNCILLFVWFFFLIPSLVESYGNRRGVIIVSSCGRYSQICGIGIYWEREKERESDNFVGTKFLEGGGSFDFRRWYPRRERDFDQKDGNGIDRCEESSSTRRNRSDCSEAIAYWITINLFNLLERKL